MTSNYDKPTATAAQLSTLQLGIGVSNKAISGTDRYFLDLLRALPSVGVSARGLVRGEVETIANPVPGVTSFAPINIPRLRRWRRARSAVRDAIIHSDITVSHSAFSAFPVLDILKKLPLIVHFHGPRALESRAEGRGALAYHILRMQEQLNYRQAARFIVLSHAFGDILSREYDVNPERIRVIPGGVHLERFTELPSRREARERLGWPLDRPIIATARRLVPSKGIERLIDAIAQVKEQIPEIFCAIAGTGPLAADLQQRIGERNVAANVRLIGFVPDDVLSLVYRASDLFVVPTIAFEGFGLAVIEALACGTPTIVTPVGGLPEAVSGLESSLVLQGMSVGDIADGISQALSGALVLPTSDACVDHARRFDWKVIASRVADVYREVV